MKNIFILILSVLILNSCDDSSGNLESSDDGGGLNVNKTVEIVSGDTAIRGDLGSKTQLEFIEINVNEGINGYTWSSSDENIVSINQNGVATGIAFGTATIKVESENDATINDEIIVNVIETEVYYSVSNSQNITSITPISGTLSSNAPNPAPTEVFNSTNVLKFEKTVAPFSFLRFTSQTKVNFGNPDNTITFWAYIEDAGNNGLVAPNNQIRIIARNIDGTGVNQAATPVQEIVGFNEWHEYTFDLTDVLVSGTDYFQINIFLAPADTSNNAEGTIYYIDNIRGPFLN